MTTTVEAPVAEATEQEAPAPKFWTVTDTYWLSERQIPEGYVFEQMPADDHPTKSAYGSNRLYLYVAREDIARGMSSGTSRSGRPYVYVNPNSAVGHDGPSTEQTRRQKILDEVADLSDEALRERYVAEAYRYQQSYWALHRYADENGYCPTFDEIMESTGWPRRPKAYSITLAVDVPSEVDGNWLQQIARGYRFPDDFKATVMQEFSTRVTSPRLHFRPETTTPVTDIWPTEEAARQHLTNYYGSRLENADWSTLRIKEVRR